MWVDNMVDQLNCKYIYKKRRVYYYSRHVPQDLLSYYDKKRIVFSLKTKSLNHASYLVDLTLNIWRMNGYLLD